MKITEVTAPSPVPPVFYSALSRAVQTIPQPRAAASQWLNLIRNLPARGAAKQGEIEYSGILPWLQQQGNNPITKDQLLQALSQNEVNVNTTIHGVSRDHVAPDEQAGAEHGAAWDALVQQQRQNGTMPLYNGNGEVDDQKYAEWVKRSNEITDQMDAVHHQMVLDTMKRQNLSGRSAHYPDYKLPGGKDYREMLLTTPPKVPPVEIGEPEPPGKIYGNTKFAANWGGDRSVQGVTAYPFKIGSETGTITYWPKTYDYKGLDGPPKFIVFSPHMQNAQFDTLEQAKEGIGLQLSGIGNHVYRTRHWKEPNIIAHTRFDIRPDATGNNTLHVAEIQSDWHQEGRKRGYKSDPIQPVELLYQQGPRPRLQIAYNQGKEVGSVEQMTPTTWRAYDNNGSLGETYFSEEEAKQALQTKISDNLDKSRVPNGPFKREWPLLAVKRLIRQAIDNGIDRITWDIGDTHAKRYQLSNHVTDITLAGSGNNLVLNATGRNGRKVIQDQAVTPENLSDYIGKEAAERLLAQPELDGSNPYAVRGLYGEDLHIGGEGMRGFYDQMLPMMINKWAKRFGSQVTRTRVNINDPADEFIPLSPDEQVPQQRRRYAPAWELIITPQMAQAVNQGQPLWESVEEPIAETRLGLYKLPRNIGQFLYIFVPRAQVRAVLQQGLESTGGPLYLFVDEKRAHAAAGPPSVRLSSSLYVLMIDTAQLDQSRLGPDDIKLPQLLRGKMNKLGLIPGMVSWQHSLALCGQCTYTGIIPPGALRMTR